MTPAEILKELDELDTRLERLRIKYDQFFTGTEKSLPFVLRKDVDRRFQALHRVQMRNTAARFRFQTLVQRFTMYQTYWNRIIRQIEEGTFKRDVVRAQRLGLGRPTARDVSESPAGAEAPPDDAAEELDDSDVEDFEPLEPEPAAAPLRPEALAALESVFGEAMPTKRRAPALPRLEEAVEPSIARPLPRPDDEHVPPPHAPSLQPPAPRMPAAPLRAPSSLFSDPAPSAPPSLRGAAPPPATRPSAPTAQPPGAGPVRPPPVATSAPPRPSAPQAPSAAPPRASAPQAPAPAQRSAPPPSEDAAMRQLYERFVTARKQTGESTDVRYETVAKQVRETLPRLAEKYQGADVRLDVTIKDGKAILRPVVTVKK